MNEMAFMFILSVIVYKRSEKGNQSHQFRFMFVCGLVSIHGFGGYL